jgi:hypothetical protein
MHRRFYAIGWAAVGAVMGVLAATLAIGLSIVAVVCFALGLAVERQWIGLHEGHVSWDRAISLLPFEVRRKPHAARPEPPLGMLDFEHLALKAIERSSRILNQMAVEQNRMTAMISRYTPRFAAIGAASSDRKIRLSKEFATKLEGFVRRLDDGESAFRSETEVMAVNYLRRIEGASAGPDLTSFRGTIAGMRDVTTTSRASASGWRQSIVDLRTQNIQQSINEALDHLVAVATRLISDFDRTIRFTTEALELIDAKTTEATAQSTPRTPKAPNR